MPYNNNYTNQDRDNNSEYLKPDASPLGKVLGGLLALGMTAAVGHAAFKSGAARPIVEAVIKNLGEYNGSKLSALSQGLKVWSSEGRDMAGSLARGHWYQNIKNLVSPSTRESTISQTVEDLKKLREHMTNANRKFMEGVESTARGASAPSSMHYIRPEATMITDFNNFNKIDDDVRKDLASLAHSGITPGQYDVSVKDADAFREMMKAHIWTRHNVKAEDQRRMIKQTGHRLLTLGDVFDAQGNVSNSNLLHNILDENTYNSFANSMKSYIGDMQEGHNWRNLKFDHDIMIHHKTRELSDVRAYRNSIRTFTQTLTNNYKIPFIGINPMRLLFLNRMPGLAEEKPIFAILDSFSKQPGVTNNAERIGHKLLYLDKNIYGMKQNAVGHWTFDLKNPVKEGYHLENGNAAVNQVARYYAELAGIPQTEYRDIASDEGIRSLWSKVAKKLDIGYQDSPAQELNVFNPFTWMSTFDKFIKGPGRPSEIINKTELKNLFGSGKYIAMKDSIKITDIFRTDKEAKTSDYIKQFFVSRKTIEDVTPTSLIATAFFSRLSGGLGTLGLGFNVEGMTSAAAMYKKLMFQRVLPIIGGAVVWHYFNYEAEKITGSRPKDELATGYVNAKMHYGALKDLFGITKFFKRLGEVTPGSDQINELPGIGALDLDKTQQEMQDYYTDGEEEVRKGRYWPIGNTPFTGGKVDYYRPNWYRRLKSNWKMTDTVYGSEDEYYANAPFPTIEHPFAPIKHFITDNRHMEMKHYNDRPYMISEGIPELKHIPLIGGLIDSTIGHVLKPQLKMHPDYWEAIENGTPMPDQMNSDISAPQVEGEQPVDTNSSVGYTGNGMADGADTGAATIAPATPGGSGIGVAAPSTYNQRDTTTAKNDGSTTLTYVTASGQIQVVEAPGRVHIKQLNKAIHAASLAKSVRGIRNKYVDQKTSGPVQVDPDNIPAANPAIKNTIIDIGELGGIYGFAAVNALGIDPSQDDEMATPDEIDNMSDDFWDFNMGGLGGEASEIYRRFIPRNKNKMHEFNPIRNTQPGWVPGSNYFLDLQHGDPYRMPYGEVRVPGSAYEKINNMGNIMDLPARASMLGYSKEDMMKYFYHENDVMSEYAQEATEAGDVWHKRLERQWAKEGTLIEGEHPMHNEKYNYTGHYDAKVVDYSVPQGQAIVDIKTVNQRRYDEVKKSGGTLPHHREQVNVYLHENRLPKGYVYYVNRDDKKAEPIIRDVHYDDKLYKAQMETLESARAQIRADIASGKTQRGDLYDYYHRFLILSDVAPYSNEYKEYRSLLSSLQLTDEQKEEINNAKKRTRTAKKRTRTYEYQFSTASIDYETVHVTQKLKNDMFMTEEYPDNPIRFAGIKVSSAKDDKTAQAAGKYLDFFIHPGSTVRIGYDHDQARKVSRDTYKTIRATVSAKGVDNLNRELLKKGLAKEKETDYSPAGVHARFSPGEIAIGSAWEKIAHLDTFVNSKFLQVRSALEDYKRRQIYGKDFQDWKNPLRDFIVPTIDSAMAQRGPVVGMAMGAIVGLLFGKTTYGKVVGTLVGAGLGLAAGTSAKAYEAKTGNRWIPERRRKERDINEYIDILKYVKARRLFTDYAQQAKDKENFDVAAYIKKQEDDGKHRKEQATKLMKVKRSLHSGDITYLEALKQAHIDWKELDTLTKARNENEKQKIKQSKAEHRAQNKERLKNGNKVHEYVEVQPRTKETKERQRLDDANHLINQKIAYFTDYRKVEELPPLATKALQYYLQTKRTMYGYEQGDPVMNAMAALPRKDREYFQAFLEAPEKEKPEILSVAPRYMRRMLESSWGLPVEEKKPMVDYFQNRQLPSANWEGWREDQDLNVVKVKMVKHEAMDATEFNIWPDDTKAAMKQPVRAPKMNTHDSAMAVKRKLEDVLHGAGYEDIDIQIDPAAHDRMDVHVDVKQDKRQQIEEWLKDNGHKLLS